MYPVGDHTTAQHDRHGAEIHETIGAAEALGRYDAWGFYVLLLIQSGDRQIDVLLGERLTCYQG